LFEIEKKLSRSISIIPMIESARGIDQLKDISSHPSVVRLTLGNIDLQANLGMKCSPAEEELLPLKFQMVLMSRLFELAPPIDGVTVEFTSTETIAADVQRAKSMGFSGKLCIHPSQIEPVIQGFMPTLAEVENAKAIVIADSNANGGAVQLNGKMVDRPVVLMAKLVLQQAGIQ
jgi:citrate lyase subunit beta/citryl-CoA lyase